MATPKATVAAATAIPRIHQVRAAATASAQALGEVSAAARRAVRARAVVDRAAAVPAAPELSIPAEARAIPPAPVPAATAKAILPAKATRPGRGQLSHLTPAKAPAPRNPFR